MKDIWYTLAVSEMGTHKMRIREKMTKKNAEELAVKYCKENGLEYRGTFSPFMIDYEEAELRKEIY
jgi:hypothetical protein